MPGTKGELHEKKKVPLPSLRAAVAFLRESVCVHAHAVHELVFVLHQSLCTCEQRCSVRSRVAAIWLGVTSASVRQICSSAAGQTAVYPPESSRQSGQQLQSQPNKSQAKEGTNRKSTRVKKINQPKQPTAK